MSLLKWMVVIFLLIFLREPVSKYIKKSTSAVDHVHQTAQTSLQLRSYKSLLSLYFQENGKLPDDLGEWLRQEFNLSTGKDAALDAWGQPFVKFVEGGTQGIRSPGPDGVTGTEDDMVSVIVR
ncbi:MAG: hypothetical protein SFY92_07635 [Verrucomicrobiae bacterium]|nr:hypothetical protein [Verrucomicrobiae bacterium]